MHISIIMIAIMIIIIVQCCHIVLIWPLELERFESATFILPHHCPAILTIFEGLGTAARVLHGEGPDGASIPGPDQFLFIFTFTFWSAEKQHNGSVRP